MRLPLSRRARYFAVIVSVALCARGAEAQAPANRFWASLGGGFGHSGPSNSTGLDQFTGPSADIAVGVTMTSRGLVGIEVAGWRRSTPIGSSRSTFVSLTLIGYPFGSVLDNLYLQGGLGFGNASFPTQQLTTTPSRMNVTGPSLQVGVGYDFPIACPLWITPFFQSYGTFGGRRFTGAPLPAGDHESANAVLFHAGLLLRFARPGAPECRSRGAALGG
ncbi:MAG TPA: hypothetical protein VH539_07470 [Gemmatimonadaceae bacterium]|jgi:hypothetical protein